MTTPQHCPGFQSFKSLTSFTCNCPECGKAVEVFSDEFEREHYCKGCGKKIDFTKCKIEASA